MKSKVTVFEANTKMGPVLVADISDRYAQKIALAYEKGTYEKSNTDLISQLSFDYFFDVGAAYGYYSLFALASGAKACFAYEAQPFRYGLLWWNVKDLEIYPFLSFVGEHYNPDANKKVFISKAIGGLVGVAKVSRAEMKNTQVLTFTSLDEEVTNFVNPRFIDLGGEVNSPLIKVDVEGFEREVIKGAKTILELPDSKWIIESHKAFLNNQDIINDMSEYGYKHDVVLETAKNAELFFYK